LLVGDALGWLSVTLPAQLKRACGAPFESFLAHAERALQDRTGALEASVPLEDLLGKSHRTSNDPLLGMADSLHVSACLQR
jgi:hypothetical protein